MLESRHSSIITLQLRICMTHTYSDKRVVAQKGRLLDVCAPKSGRLHNRCTPLFDLQQELEVCSAWRTSLHVYVANEALQHTRCPRDLCCMKAVLAFKQLRSCLHIPAATEDRMEKREVNDILDIDQTQHKGLAKDMIQGMRQEVSCHCLQGLATVLAPVAHALHACPMSAAALTARCRACLPVSPGLKSAWRIVRVRRRWRRNIVVHGRTHGLGPTAVRTAAAMSSAFPIAAPAPAGTRAHVRQDALAHLVKDWVTGPVGEGALKRTDCRRCSLRAQ